MLGLTVQTSYLLLLLLLALFYGALGQSQGLSEEEQEEILSAHNHYRRTVDPIATNMLQLVGCPYNNLHTQCCNIPTGVGR